MHENNFEKQVREKMDQLGFDPTDAVWTRVDQEINKEKRKRRPLFWIFFLSGLLVGAAGFYSVMRINSEVETNTTNSERHTAVGHKTFKTNQAKNKTSDNSKIKQSDHFSTSLSSDIHNKNRASAAMHNQKPASRTDSKIREGGISILNTGETKKTKVSNSIGIGENPDAKISADNMSAEKNIPAIAASKEQKTNKSLIADSALTKKSAENQVQKVKTKTWSISITATTGISSINQSLFQSVNAANNSYYAYTPSNSSAGPPPPVPYHPSDVQPGFSFGVGIMVNRKLSKRVALSAGLNYQYFSTIIHTGSASDSARYVYAAGGQATLVNTFYQGGQSQSYINQYHFVGLPVVLSLQMNKSNKNPVNWEAGFSLAWLLNSNALHFDPNANVYFKNNQLFNKIQWNATTAVLVGFPVFNHSFELGPQIQYGLSGLVKDNSENPGHLFYLGLKMSFIP